MKDKQKLIALTIYLDNIKHNLRNETIAVLQVYMDEGVKEINQVILESDDKSVNYKLLCASTNAKQNMKNMIIGIVSNIDKFLYKETEKVIEGCCENGIDELVVNTYVEAMTQNFNTICLPIAVEQVQKRCIELKKRLIGEIYK